MMILPTQNFLDVPAMNGVCEHFRLSYLEWPGPAKAPLLFCVHGLTRNAHDFAMLASSLSRHYRVVAVDMPGRGDSQWLEDKHGYSYPTYIHACDSLLTHLAPQKLYWLGTSMGGIIAMVFSALYPKRIDALIMNDVGKFIPKSAMARIASYAGVPHVFPTRWEAEDFLRVITQPFAIPDESSFHYMAQHSILEVNKTSYILACDPEILTPYREQTDNFSNVTDIDLGGYWQSVTCPVLLLRGETSDILPEQTAKQMMQEKPVTFVEFKNVGHAPALMDAEQTDTVKRWLALQV